MDKNLKNIAWFAGYIGVLALIVVSMNNYRNNAIANHGTAEATENWQQWRDAAEEMGREGSVERDAPKSEQPPSLVLMRDHYPACLGISLLLSSCLYLWFMVCARGALKPVQINEDDF